MALDLTPEQQEIFDRVVGVVTQNDELRHQFKTAVEELRKQPEWQDFNYRTDSDDPAAVNARSANAAVRAEISKVAPNLKSSDSLLFGDVYIAIGHNFLRTKAEGSK
jgi:hypothetical protein